MGAERGGRLLDFSLFCNTKPFSAKVMLLKCIFAIINVNAKNFMHIGLRNG